MDWSRLLPLPKDEYRGSKGSFYFLILIAAISTVRSLIHIIAADGGAQSIAGINVNVTGGVNIIAIFAQWGSIQLLLAFVYWLVILRYRSLIPAALSMVIIEQLLRIGVGLLKPFEVTSPPPGAYGSYILLPLAVVFLLLSLRQKSDSRLRSPGKI
jgi:hypothetical protein